ncbi:alpha/beta hydrolase [Pseudooceanicola onchidii]|uniref:alpha/beta hydrolase n=1 Tax=Pseudooceanicola onchidii TaxID=2562279 RepID=UPI0010AAEBBE|nr:alpha/beta hydrolase [Pseudooceanicola onchidii]
MALARINVTNGRLAEHRTGRPVEIALAPHLPGTAPVIVMIHGFKFTPGGGRNCPHDHILSLRGDNPCWKARSWPAGLGLDTSDTLGIAFGWAARGSIWQAYDRAAEAGRALARMIRLLRDKAPDRPVHILAHSLGARVALSALPYLRAGDLDRVVLLAGAEFRATAQDLTDTPAGRRAQIISITSRENRPYERLMERLLGGPARGRCIGRDAPGTPNWLTLPLDADHVLAALRALGHPIAPPQHWVCHWSSYLRPGVFSLYAALLADPSPLPITRLRRLIERPAPQSARWRPDWSQIPLPLPGAGRAAG